MEMRRFSDKCYPELQRKLLDSRFPFTKRMRNMLDYLEVNTVGQLAAIPLKDLHNFKGFKTQCKKELIAFIEFECLQDFFEGYWKWKKI